MAWHGMAWEGTETRLDHWKRECVRKRERELKEHNGSQLQQHSSLFSVNQELPSLPLSLLPLLPSAGQKNPCLEADK